jgi:hypothetical protein
LRPHQNARANVKAAARLSAEDERIAELLERISSSCHPKQRAFAEDNHRRVSALVGRGGGKTTGYKARVLRKLLTIKRAKLVYIALSKPHAEELLWEPLIYTCTELGLVDGKDILFSNNKLKLTFLRTGAQLALFGADKWGEIEKLRGKPFHDVGVDEAASHDEKRLQALLQKIVGPRLGDHKGSFVLLGTPGEVLGGTFYEATVPGGAKNRPYADRYKPEYADWIGWSSHYWSLSDPETQAIQAMRNQWEEAQNTKAENLWSDDNPIWRREYLGEWAADNTATIFVYQPVKDGQPWNQWDPPRGFGGMADMAKLPPGPDDQPRKDWHYAYGLDMGHSDPFALQVFAFSPSDPTRTIYHVFEFERTAMYARLIAQLMLGAHESSPSGCMPHEKPGGVLGATGWPVGMVADVTHLGGSVLDELAKVYGIRVAPAEQSKGHRHAAVELFNGDLVDGRLKILKGSRLEQQMQSLQWDQDEFGMLRWPKGKPDHATDAAIYCRRLIASLFDSGTVQAPAKQQSYVDPQELGSDEPSGGEFSSLLSEDAYDDMWGG